MSETGVVKFDFEHTPSELAPFAHMDELNACRDRLLALGWIGVDANGIGFGNISVRNRAMKNFYITASGTGRLPGLHAGDFARVTAYDFERNWLSCEGAVASSESLTHAAVYQADESARAVIHCHSAELWRRLLDVVPTTSRGIEYGTPEMANEVLRLFSSTDVKRQKIFAMAGHPDGIVAFGATLDEAFAALQR
ncbi:MAG: class II aldolase/adducin family protein [Chthoniobacterales bacterium]